MENSFKELLRVSLSNSYFSGGVIPGTAIMPTAETKKAMQNYGILFRQTAHGLILLCRVQSFDSDTPLINPQNAGKFTFLLYLSNNYFTNFTDLPLEPESGEIYHFSNLNSNVQNGDALLTSSNSKEFTTEDDLIRLRPKRFTHSDTSGGLEVTVEIKDENDVVVISEKTKVNDGRISYNVDLVGYASGKYKIYVSGIHKYNFYADDNIYSRKPFGIIDINLTDSLPAAYSVIATNSKISKKIYHIKFNNRKTYWKYIIVLKNQTSINPDKLEINYPDNSNSFNKQAEFTLPEGETAITFVSANEIELEEDFLKGIQLHKTGGNNSGWFDIDNLPNASVKNIIPDIPNDKIYSEIYIYI